MSIRAKILRRDFGLEPKEVPPTEKRTKQPRKSQWASEYKKNAERIEKEKKTGLYPREILCPDCVGVGYFVNKLYMMLEVEEDGDYPQYQCSFCGRYIVKSDRGPMKGFVNDSVKEAVDDSVKEATSALGPGEWLEREKQREAQAKRNRVRYNKAYHHAGKRAYHKKGRYR